jgi:hypothetical protein
MAKAKEASTEIAVVDSIRAVDKMTAEEYMDWLSTESIEVVDFDGGSDWELIGDKDELIGKDFVIARIRFNSRANGQSWDGVSVCAYDSKDGKKFIFNDGGTGVYNQLQNYVDTHGVATGIRCKRGLRVSRYTYTDEKGKEAEAATYYLA